MFYQILALAAVAAAQTSTTSAPTTSANSAQLEQITSAYSSYILSVGSDPSVRSLASRIASDLPEDSRDDAVSQLSSLYANAIEDASETPFDPYAFATSPVTSLPDLPFLTEVPAADATSFFAYESSVAAGVQSIVASVLSVSPGGVNVQTPTFNAGPAVTPPPVYKIAGGVVAGVGMAAAVML